MFAECTRRQWLSGIATAALSRNRAPGFATSAPTAPVAVAKCPDYGPALLPAMQRMFDQLGDIGTLVRGKTVAIKINLTGPAAWRVGHAPPEVAHWTHPRVIGATIHLLGKLGARRIRILESAWSTADPLEEFLLRAGWEPRDLLSAAPNVQFENTNFLGSARKYARLPVPGGGYMFPAFDLNHSYADCDVYVSIAKLKQHFTCGVTLSLKNCFGIMPCTIYGDGAGVDEPGLLPAGGRNLIMHRGQRQPSRSAPPENDPASPRQDGYRVPRIVADLVHARPIHLAIIDGIATMTGAEGPWLQGVQLVKPGVLVASTNAVTADTVAMAIMGYDPLANRGKAPFETCDNILGLAEDRGIGTRDPGRIEVLGTRIEEARFDFKRFPRGSTYSIM